MSMDTELERERMPVNVEFGMRGENMFFKIGNQSFLLDYKPAEPGEFEFMQKMLLSAFSSITPCVKTASEPVNARILDVSTGKLEHINAGLCAVDPRVSGAASDLVEKARAEAIGNAADWLEGVISSVTCMIEWIKGGCDTKLVLKELRILRGYLRAKVRK